ncbi:hypothetical protein LTV02_24590 [Nocardia yamanashiensis]|uniref:hypothetical protein n=1 Tax=Nocardia yamanashiensis TaxID=209247 RepID=UPI00082E3369|nr:hypothetical protein [Nocardia yamanashiensis]UGT39249.1 hypothetical protein LTV02_24590 [Nocardia yamanashiensis]
MRWLAVLAEVVLVPLLGFAAVWCWRNGIHTGWFKPAGETPGFTATRYSGPWLACAALLVTVAGVIFIDVLSRVYRLAR